MTTQEEFFGDVQQPDVVAPEQPATAQNMMQQNLTADEFFGQGDVKIHSSVDDEESLGFGQRLAKDIEKRYQVDLEIKKAYEEGEIGLAEGLLQTIGKTGFGFMMDFLGEVVTSAGHGLSAITPEIIKQPLKAGATAAGHMLLNTEIGQQGLHAAKAGVEAWTDFKNDNPRAARNIEAIVNIGVMLTPIKAKPKIPATPASAAKPTILGKVAQTLDTRATTQVLEKRTAFLDDLVTPKLTAAVKTEQVGRTAESGLLRQKVVTPSAIERHMAEEVGKIQGVAPNKSLQANYNVIADEVTREANVLKSALADKDVIFPRKEFLARLEQASQRLADNPLLAGDAEKSAQRIVDKMRQIVNGKKSTGSNLLAARKELDAWIKSQKGESIFDPAKESALSIAIREIRQTTNGFLAEKAPNIGVRESLKKQSTLLSAMDNIAPKAADEASNVILRAWRNIHQVLPLRGEFNQSMAVLFGVGGLGAAAIFAPFFTKLALTSAATYAFGKALVGPNAKKGMSLLLKTLDQAITKTNDAQLISTLRLDRAAIVEILQLSGEHLKEMNDDGSPSKTD